jgi:hypothetical protein
MAEPKPSKPPKPKKPTAQELLRPSRLHQTQLELMGDDVDITDLYLALNYTGFNIQAAVTDVVVDRTIEGASTVTVTVLDRDRLLLRSGRLSSRNDIEIDGLFFRLASVRKQGDILELIFEDREVAILRKYAKPIKQSVKTSRGRVTRAEFVLRMIKEVKEFHIATTIPELHKTQPIDGAKQRGPTAYQQQEKTGGIPKSNDLKVKNADMTENQRQIANSILDVGTSMVLKRPLLVMAIMCATQESAMTNLLPWPHGGPLISTKDPLENPTGVFQQRYHVDGKRSSWAASRDVEKDAASFLEHLVPMYASEPHKSYGEIIDHVQVAGTPNAFQQWKTQAERTVTAYGVSSGDATSNNAQYDAAHDSSSAVYEFYRGLPPTSKLRKQKFGGKWGPENSWDCIQRLAGEVQWRAFMVSGRFYFIAEDTLFKSKPLITLEESSVGIQSIDGDYDEGSKVATVRVVCRIGRWRAPPGSVIQLVNMGPWNGRWLVNDISRSLFNSEGTITLKKPWPRLPEPSGKNLVNDGSHETYTDTPKSGDTNAPQRAPTGDASVLAGKLLVQHTAGKWRDDNGYGLSQIQAAAAGLMVRNRSGVMVPIDPGPIRLVLWLIENGYTIGTYAWASDHHDDGPRGHAGGFAVDISSINKVGINQDTPQMRKLVLEVAQLIHDATGALAPRQLITGGYGNKRDMTISALSIPAADSFYGSDTMAQHCNHIHAGYGNRKNGY